MTVDYKQLNNAEIARSSKSIAYVTTPFCFILDVKD